jgi:hypothetical protein
MKAEFTVLVQQLIAAQGRDALFNSTKCKAFLATAQGANISEKRLLQQAVESGITSGIANASNIAAYKAQAAQKLQADYFLAPNVANGVVDVLIGLIRTVPPAQPQQSAQQLAYQSPVQQTTYQSQQPQYQQLVKPRRQPTAKSPGFIIGMINLVNFLCVYFARIKILSLIPEKDTIFIVIAWFVVTLVLAITGFCVSLSEYRAKTTDRGLAVTGMALNGLIILPVVIFFLISRSGMFSEPRRR